MADDQVKPVKEKGNTVTINRSPLRWIGSKSRLIQKNQLWEYFPARIGHSFELRQNGVSYSMYSIYLELFAGSSVMFFNLSPPPLVAVINDINDELYNFWNVIKNNFEELQKQIAYTWNGDSWLEEFEGKTDPVSRAIAFYIRNRRGSFIQGNPAEFYKDFTFWKQRMDKARLAIWHKDYKEVMAIIDRPRGKNRGSGHSEWVYVIYQDPPYYGTESVYRDIKFTFNDHDNLAKLNHASRHWIILTYNDCPQVRELYKDWYLIELQNYYKMKNEYRCELLLSNRPLVRRKKEDRAQGKLF